MLKYRSMVVDTEKQLETMPEEKRKEFADHFKLKDDPCTTHIGKFIHETGIDGLPQCVNVILEEICLWLVLVNHCWRNGKLMADIWQRSCLSG